MTALLIAGQDYPRTYREFVTMFPNNEACASYLQQLRWPKVFVCPACGAEIAAWSLSRSRLLCSSCRHQTTVTAGTVFEKTRTPLTTWFEAAWHLTTAKNGMSAKTLQRTLGTSYRVAWTLLQRYRVAMVRADRKPLSGDVEVDETFVGGVEHGAKRGRGAYKCIVVIAVEIKQPKGFGRIRMRHVPDASANSLVPFVREVIEPGSVIVTDGWGSYTSHGHRCGFCKKLKLWIQKRFHLILISRFHLVEAIVNSLFKFRKCFVKLIIKTFLFSELPQTFNQI